MNDSQTKSTVNSAARSPLTLSVIGKFRIYRDGTSLNIRSRKEQALLSYLAITGQSHSRQHLTGLLWPDSTEKAALKNLRNTLWQLKRRLDFDIFVNSLDPLALDSSKISVDLVDVYQLLDQLLVRDDDADVYVLLNQLQNRLLDRFVVNASGEFENWLGVQQNAFARRVANVLTKLVVRYQAKKQWKMVLLLAEKGNSFEPFNETFAIARIKSYRELGEMAHAMKFYQEFHSQFQQEMGFAPSAEIHTIANTLGQRQTPAQESSGDLTARAFPLVDREAQQRQLTRLFAQAALAGPVAGLVIGRQGSGKTFLVDHFAQQNKAKGYNVYIAWQHLGQAQLQPFQPLLPVLRQIMQKDRAGMALLTQVQRQALAYLLPEFTVDTLPPNAPSPQLLYNLFAQLVVRHAQSSRSQPLTLCLDNNWWRDEHTRQALTHLLNLCRTTRCKLLLLFTLPQHVFRQSDAPASWLIQLEREFNVTRIPLRPLSRSAVARLAATALGNTSASKEQIDMLLFNSAGNPWQLIQLLNTDSTKKLPPPIVDSARTKMRRLPRSAQHVLQIMAVWETPIRFGRLMTLSQQSESTFLNAIDAAINEDIIEETDKGAYRFIFPLEQRAVVEQLGTGRRQLIRERIAGQRNP